MSNWATRALLFFSAGAWAATMTTVGVLLLVDWPGRFDGIAAPWRVFGAVLVAAGLFIFAATAGRAFPLAGVVVRSAFEAAPFLALVAALVGGWLW